MNDSTTSWWDRALQTGLGIYQTATAADIATDNRRASEAALANANRAATAAQKPNLTMIAAIAGGVLLVIGLIMMLRK